MKKNSDGILLNIKHLGDIDIVVNILTRDFGIISGLIKAGQTKKLKSQYQIGNVFSVEWFARLPEQLGRIKTNLILEYYYLMFDDINRLELLICMCNILNVNLINYENSKAIYDDTLNMINVLCNFKISYKELLKYYFLYEKSLLANLGFGLDLSKCTVTGETDISKLKYISPTTAKAVSEVGGAGYEKKLFKMPQFFLLNSEGQNIEKNEFIYANNALSYFIEKNLFIDHLNINILTHRNSIINRIIKHIT